MSTIRLVRENPSELYFAHAPLSGLVFGILGSGLAWFGLFRLEDDGLGRWMLGGMGVLFAIIGLLGTLWRYELTLDLLSRTYRGRRGFWPSPRPLQGSLDELRGVVIKRVWQRSSSSKGGSTEYVTWTLSLDFGEWSVRFFASRNEARAFARLEHFARLLRVHAIDRTGDEETRRAWDELDRSLAERAQSSKERPAAPGPPPSDSRILWEPASGTASIVLPRAGFSRGTVFLTLFGLLFAGFGILPLLALTGIWDVPVSGSRAAGWIVGLLFCLIGLAIVFFAIWGSYAREVVREERDGLQFYITLFGWRHRRRFIPKHEIEEVAARPSTTRRHRRRPYVRIGGMSFELPLRSPAEPEEPQEVVVRSDKLLVKVGGDLTADEQEWLCRALTYLAAR